MSRYAAASSLERIAAALQGAAPTTRPDLDAGEEHLIVNFPQELLREYPDDVPWDDPELIEAMLAL